VWVRGEHDIATKDSLVVAIAYAGQLEHADVFVDLSELTFMDASTIGAIVGSANRLRSHSQSLALRAPSPRALRVLDLCGLAPLVHPAVVPAVHQSGVAAALSTSVGPTGRSDAACDPQRRRAAVSPGDRIDARHRRRRGGSWGSVSGGRERRLDLLARILDPAMSSRRNGSAMCAPRSPGADRRRHHVDVG
jgi:anti-anti-sigma factor